MHRAPLRAKALVLLICVLAGCSKSSEVPPAGAPAPAEAVPSAVPAAAAPEQGLPAPPPPAPAAAPAEEVPKSAQKDEFSTLEAAEKALAQAQSELNRVAMLEPQRPSAGASAGRDEAERKAPSKKARASAPAPAGAGAGLGAPGGEAASASCDNVCRAYSSLLRAASAVCRIDGDSGAHCAHAKQVRADAERRVASCSCPAP